ncbi:hypothetical protein ACO0QE_000209 [Hanseniaspora vineae]
MSLFTTTTNIALSEPQFFAHSQQQQQQQQEQEQQHQQQQQQEQENFDFTNFMLSNDSESEQNFSEGSVSSENVNPASFIADWLKEDDPIFTFEDDEAMTTLKYEKQQEEEQEDVKEQSVSQEEQQDNYWNCLFDDVEQPPMDTIDGAPFVKQEETENQEDQEEIDLMNLDNDTVSFGFLPTPVLEEDEKLPVTKTKSKTETAKVANTSSKPKAKVNKVTKTKRSTSPSTSTSTSPKLDQLGIVSYTTKKRSMPLTEIKIDELQDPVELKRAKNTEAARRSRARKFQRMQQLEDKVAELLEINASLVKEIERLKNGNI